VKFGKVGGNSIHVLHSLRHSYGTRLVDAGAHGEEIQRLMGHKGYRVTQRYIRVTRDQLAATVRRVFG
jgi:site-specific recombinase XerD